MRVCVDLAETLLMLLMLLTNASPLPHKRPSAIELYTADENGWPDAFVMSLPMPKEFPMIVGVQTGRSMRYFAYSDQSSLFVETNPYWMV